MANKAELENGVRARFMDAVAKMVQNEFDTDALLVGPNEIAIPCLDADGNETWSVIKVSTPRGTRNGEGGYIPYDGYAAADAYKGECEERATKKAKSAAKKEAEQKERERKRAEKENARKAKEALAELKKIKVAEEE